MMILREPPRPPSQLVPGLPFEMDSVILKSLQKEGAKRYSHPEEFYRALYRLHQRFGSEDPDF